MTALKSYDHNINQHVVKIIQSSAPPAIFIYFSMYYMLIIMLKKSQKRDKVGGVFL